MWRACCSTRSIGETVLTIVLRQPFEVTNPVVLSIPLPSLPPVLYVGEHRYAVRDSLTVSDDLLPPGRTYVCRQACVYRHWSASNDIVPQTHNLYGLEAYLHETLLQSEHRYGS